MKDRRSKKPSAAVTSVSSGSPSAAEEESPPLPSLPPVPIACRAPNPLRCPVRQNPPPRPPPSDARSFPHLPAAAGARRVAAGTLRLARARAPAAKTGYPPRTAYTGTNGRHESAGAAERSPSRLGRRQMTVRRNRCIRAERCHGLIARKQLPPCELSLSLWPAGGTPCTHLVPVQLLPPPLRSGEAPYPAELEAARPAAPQRALVAPPLRGRGPRLRSVRADRSPLHRSVMGEDRSSDRPDDAREGASGGSRARLYSL